MKYRRTVWFWLVLLVAIALGAITIGISAIAFTSTENNVQKILSVTLALGVAFGIAISLPNVVSSIETGKKQVKLRYVLGKTTTITKVKKLLVVRFILFDPDLTLLIAHSKGKVGISMLSWFTNNKTLLKDLEKTTGVKSMYWKKHPLALN